MHPNLQKAMVEAAQEMAKLRIYNPDGSQRPTLALHDAVNMIEYHRPASFLSIMEQEKNQREWWLAALYEAGFIFRNASDDLKINGLTIDHLNPIYHDAAERAWKVYNPGKEKLTQNKFWTATDLCRQDVLQVTTVLWKMKALVYAIEQEKRRLQHTR